MLVKNAGMIVGVFSITVLLTSCAVGPDYKRPDAKIADEWLADPAVAGRSSGVAEKYWWRHFGDPVLDRLVEVALNENLPLQEAGVRILEARASLNKSAGDLFPQQQGVSGQVGQSSQPSKISGKTADYTSAQTLFAASWEIDVWGKYRRQIESDKSIFLGKVAAYDDVMVTLIADVASAYITICTLEERIRVVQGNIDIEKESLRIAAARHKAGELSERDMQQASAQLAGTQAGLPQMQEVLRQVKNGLAVLLGQTPESIDKYLVGERRIPETVPAIAAGIPKDLLRRRPDVRAAGYAAAAKSALIGVAKANMYPSFSLSGSFGFSSTQSGLSLSDFSWGKVVQTGASFMFPVFNYGRLVNQVRVQDAQFQEAILNYQNTVLMAAKEVEDALATVTYQGQAVVALGEAVKASQRSLKLAMLQYKSGETDFTTVLNAQQAVLSSEDALTSARGNVDQGVIAAYRALGGGWEIREGREIISDDVKAEMTRRTNWGKI